MFCRMSMGSVSERLQASDGRDEESVGVEAGAGSLVRAEEHMGMHSLRAVAGHGAELGFVRSNEARLRKRVGMQTVRQQVRGY